jgi:hypothetical protein
MVGRYLLNSVTTSLTIVSGQGFHVSGSKRHVKSAQSLPLINLDSQVSNQAFYLGPRFEPKTTSKDAF